MRNFTIDPEFRDKIPPLTPEEFKKLEENILEDGEVREPLVVWKNTIIDGHHRWKIIQEHPEIPFKVKQMEFSDKWAAIVWMCRNQLGRRNLTEEQKSYLRGKQFDAIKKSAPNLQGVNQYSKVARQNVGQPKARREQRDGVAGLVGKEHGVDGRTIQRDSAFASGLDAAEKVSPGIKEAVLSGEVKAPKSMIAGIRNLPAEKAKEAADAIMRKDIPSAKETIKPPLEEKEEEKRPAYNVEDFRNDLKAAVNTFDFSLRQHMVLAHMDILQTKEGREAAEQTLLEAKAVIKRYFIHIDSIVIGEEKNGKKD